MVTPGRFLVAMGALVAILGGIVSCGTWVAAAEHREGDMAGRTIEAVLSQHTRELLSLPGVVGAGIGECEGKPCIKVLVVQEIPELVNKIPETLEGYRVVIEETGEIRALHPR